MFKVNRCVVSRNHKEQNLHTPFKLRLSFELLDHTAMQKNQKLEKWKHSILEVFNPETTSVWNLFLNSLSSQKIDTNVFLCTLEDF